MKGCNTYFEITHIGCVLLMHFLQTSTSSMTLSNDLDNMPTVLARRRPLSLSMLPLSLRLRLWDLLMLLTLLLLMRLLHRLLGKTRLTLSLPRLGILNTWNSFTTNSSRRSSQPMLAFIIYKRKHWVRQVHFFSYIHAYKYLYNLRIVQLAYNLVPTAYDPEGMQETQDLSLIKVQ